MWLAGLCLVPSVLYQHVFVVECFRQPLEYQVAYASVPPSGIASSSQGVKQEICHKQEICQKDSAYSFSQRHCRTETADA